MNKTILLLSLLVLTVLTSCDSREKQVNKLRESSIEVDSMLKMNPVLTVEHRVKTEELIEDYLDFSNSYPKDSLSPQFLFKSAMLYHILSFYKEEVTTLEILVERHPDSEFAPQALATAARITEENLGELEKSITYLQQLKEKYPESPYSTNIDLQIEYAGDDEALLNAIMEKQGVNLDSLLNAADSIDTVVK